LKYLEVSGFDAAAIEISLYDRRHPGRAFDKTAEHRSAGKRLYTHCAVPGTNIEKPGRPNSSSDQSKKTFPNFP
jgi:hypothetical protein